MDKLIHHRVVREFGGEYANLRKLEKLLRAVFERLDKDKARVVELEQECTELREENAGLLAAADADAFILGNTNARVHDVETDLEHERAVRRRAEADHEHFMKEVIEPKLEAAKETEGELELATSRLRNAAKTISTQRMMRRTGKSPSAGTEAKLVASEARSLVLEQERDSHQRLCILEMEKVSVAEAEVKKLQRLCDQAYTDIADGFLKASGGRGPDTRTSGES